MKQNNEESNIKKFRECMEETVKPALNEEIYEGLIDLFHRAFMDAYLKGRREGIAEWQGLTNEDDCHGWELWERVNNDTGRSN